MKEKVKISIKGQKEYLYSTRQITQIIDTISEKHYKNEILREIAYSKNIKNIIILDESVKINQKYNEIVEENFEIDSSNLLQIYHKGVPNSLLIDENILLMNTTFKIFRELYQHHSEKDIKMSLETKENLLFELYEIITSENNLEKHIYEFFKRNSTYKNAKIVSIKKKIYNTKKLYSKYKVYRSLKNEDKKKDDEYKDIRKIEKTFLRTFLRLSKPIVFVQFENGSWKMLGIRMIKEEYFTHSNPKFVDINKVEQNSPLQIVMSVSAPFIPILTKLTIAIYKSYSGKQRLKKNIQDFEKIIEMTEEQYNNPDLTLEEVKNMDIEINKKIDDLPDDIKSKIREIQETLPENNINSLIENNIYVEEIGISEQNRQSS